MFLLNDIAKIAVRVCSLFGKKLDMLTALRVNDNDARLARNYGGLTVEVDTSHCQSFMTIDKYLGLRDIYMFEPAFPVCTPDMLNTNIYFFIIVCKILFNTSF